MTYAFEGERIKLTSKDFDRMAKLYPKLNLIEELEQLDFELREATNKAWFMTLNAKLNYRNKVAKDGKAGFSGNRKESLSERTARQTDEAIADLRTRANDFTPMGKDDGLIR